MTTYEYDDEGRVVRSVTTREAEFSAWDRALMMQSRFDEREPRGSHGHLIAEATDPANQYRATVPLPTEDFYAKKLHAVQKAYKKAYPDADMSSLLWRVEPS